MRGISYLFCLVLLGCSSRASVQAPNPVTLSGSSARGGAAEVDRIKTPARMSASSETLGSTPEAYFAHLQILSETVDGSGCDAKQGRTEELVQNFVGYVSDEAKLVSPDVESVNSLLNIEFRTIGFDEGRYQTSFVNGKATGLMPYQMSFNVRPNRVLQMKYLDETRELKLDSTPVYTFSVKEFRGACEITHNVNLFSQKSGSFARAQ